MSGSGNGPMGTAAPQFSPFLSPLPGQTGKYVVTRQGQWEVVRYALYDSQPYPAAGTPGLTFFQTPAGGAGRNESQTNMQQAGNIPNGQMFLVEAIDVKFLPVTPTGSNAAYLPAAYGAQVAALQVNDAYAFWRAGNFRLEINQKPYVQIAPLMGVPPMQQFEVQGAFSDATTAAATAQSRLAAAQVVGKPWLMMTEPLLLDQGQTFTVSMRWPEGMQPLPSGAPANIFCTLHGQFFRLSS